VFLRNNIPKKKYKFNSELQTKFPCLNPGREKNETECITFKTFMSVSNESSFDFESHITTAKHKNKSRVVIISQWLVLLNKIKKETEE
jgi:hypothetical protein